jgi:hypothetical protein
VCDGRRIIIDYETAKIIGKIYHSPIAPNRDRLWYGLKTGTGFNGLYLLTQRYFPLAGFLTSGAFQMMSALNVQLGRIGQRHMRLAP